MYLSVRYVLSPLLASVLLASCASESENPSAPKVTATGHCIAEAITVPSNFNQAVTPCYDLVTPEKITLGRFLFYDRNMSFNQTQSCGDCHQQDKAFSDGLTTSVGSEGDIHPRNSMSLTNVVYNTTQNWVNTTLVNLHSQALAVLTNEEPVELGWVNRETEILERFRNPDPADYSGTAFATTPPDYETMFARAFPGESDPYTIGNVTKAVGTFVATLVSTNSEFDKFSRGEPNTMSDAAKRGLNMFFTEKFECFHCHGGYNFNGDTLDANSSILGSNFHNNGLYDLDLLNPGDGRNGDYPADNPGLVEFTGNPNDSGKFRAPTLRNIALTAPYMHDGSLATLDAVLDHYARGGTLTATGPHAGDGALNPNKSPFVPGFTMSADEKLDLIALLESLTDMDFICNPDHADPFENIPMHPACP